jgi:ABC-2 type transport system permease protein
LYLFVILLLFGFVSIGIGLVITAFSSSSYIAGTLSTLIMTPTCMLGGCFWDITLMPEFMQKLGRFVPQWWAVNAIQNMQNGHGPADIVINLLILAGFAAALFLVATYKFSKDDNVWKFI